MFQGAGITTACAFTHRHYRQNQKVTRAKLATIKHRNAMCEKYGLTRAEYMANLHRWQELRRLVQMLEDAEQRRVDREAVIRWRIERKERIIQRRARIEEASLKQKAEAQFRGFIGPPVDGRET